MINRFNPLEGLMRLRLKLFPKTALLNAEAEADLRRAQVSKAVQDMPKDRASQLCSEMMDYMGRAEID